MNIPDLIKIKKSKYGKGLFARKPIKKGAIIFHFEGKIGSDSNTNPESLQINENKFLESTVKFDNFLNHSCNPNCHIDWKTLSLIAKKYITKGRELTYDYNTSEWDNVNLSKNVSFECSCGSKNCVGLIRGFKYLSKKEKSKRFKLLSPFLKKKFKQNQNTNPKIHNKQQINKKI